MLRKLLEVSPVGEKDGVSAVSGEIVWEFDPCVLVLASWPFNKNLCTLGHCAGVEFSFLAEYHGPPFRTSKSSKSHTSPST